MLPCTRRKARLSLTPSTRVTIAPHTLRGQRFLDDDGEHLLGTLLSQCRSLCDACVEVVACRKNVVTHMKRKHTGIHVLSTNMILEGICKKVQSRTTAARHQEGLRRRGASVTQWGLVDGYLGSTLVPLLSRATDHQWPQSALHHKTVLQLLLRAHLGDGYHLL